MDKINKKYTIVEEEITTMVSGIPLDLVLRAPAEIMDITENSYVLRFLYQTDLKDVIYEGKPEEVYTHEELIDVMCNHRI